MAGCGIMNGGMAPGIMRCIMPGRGIMGGGIMPMKGIIMGMGMGGTGDIPQGRGMPKGIMGTGTGPQASSPEGPDPGTWCGLLTSSPWSVSCTRVI